MHCARADECVPSCVPNTGSPAESRSESSRKRAISAFAILMEAVSVGTWTTATASFNFDLHGPSRHGTYMGVALGGKLRTLECLAQKYASASSALLPPCTP
jgi:hypothetical protein